MKQVCHSNETTNVGLRFEISSSKASNLALSLKYNVSKKTIIIRKTRNNFEDKSARPQTIKHILSQLEKL